MANKKQKNNIWVVIGIILFLLVINQYGVSKIGTQAISPASNMGTLLNAKIKFGAQIFFHLKRFRN